jgi:hypothetical protein
MNDSGCVETGGEHSQACESGPCLGSSERGRGLMLAALQVSLQSLFMLQLHNTFFAALQTKR